MTEPSNSFTADDQARLRSELGTGVDLDDAWTRYQRYLAAGAQYPLRDVIVEMLKERRATLLATPAQFTIQGDYQQSTQANIAGLDKQLAGYDDDQDGDGEPDAQAVTTMQLHSRWERPRTRWCR